MVPEGKALMFVWRVISQTIRLVQKGLRQEVRFPEVFKYREDGRSEEAIPGRLLLPAGERLQKLALLSPCNRFIHAHQWGY